MKYIIGNWKSNKKRQEIQEWFRIFNKFYKTQHTNPLKNLETVICPPFIYIPLVKKLRDDYHLAIKIGAQDVSPFDNGAYTGAVSALQLSEFVEYVIIGHSERRTYFKEDDSMLFEKFKKADEQKIKTVYCVQDENTMIPKGISIVAYEPVWAIGSGVADSPENANKVISAIRQRTKVKTVIYGGSVVPENARSFIALKNIDGLLPGGASLDPNKFWEIIINASAI